jgi:hypothetical protein
MRRSKQRYEGVQAIAIRYDERRHTDVPLDAVEHGQRNVAGEASRPNGSTNGEHPINPFVLRSLGVK